MKNFVTYILHSSTLNQYYIGSTGNLEERLNRHNSGRSIYTKRGIPWTVVYLEFFSTKSEAYQRELEIKSMKSRKYIEHLIEGRGV